MPSLNKSEQARINGAKSRGPNSPEGKTRSARNATTHGLTAEPPAVLLAFEFNDRFLELKQGYYDRFQPADQVERDLVDIIAYASHCTSLA